MNFISTFDELSKLYEEVDQEEIDEACGKKELTEADSKSFKNPEVDKILARLGKIADANGTKIGLDNMKDQTDLIKKQCSDAEIKLLRHAELADGTVVNLLSEELTEAADEDEEIEIVDDEMVDEAPMDVVPVEEPAEELAEEEPKQFILECSKCGALVIKDETDIVEDEESDLVNVEDECKFCEETKGYKIIGTLLPYEASEEEEVVADGAASVEEPIEEPVDEIPVE